uniref:Uncharacterized protein n=1 Tax=Siphoviridae sp. ctn8e14 TaxID=2827936 RepID=A0A8S5T579_9CAUD|nr:MAG TPA: hypothetical protein [Siphoviridae sp. ctn8e14]
MTPKQFWRTRPKQLTVLSQVHSEVVNPSTDENKTIQYADEAPFLI